MATAKSIEEQIKETKAALAKLEAEQAKESFKAYYEAVDFLKEKKIDPKEFIAWYRETFKQSVLTVNLDLPSGKETYTRWDIDLAAPKKEIKDALKAYGKSELQALVNPELKAKGYKFIATIFG